MDEITPVRPEDGRENVRKSVIWAGSCDHDSKRHEVIIRNISLGGMLIEMDCSTKRGDTLMVWHQRYGFFPGAVAWSKGMTHGISFVEAQGQVRGHFKDGLRRLGLEVEGATEEGAGKGVDQG